MSSMLRLGRACAASVLKGTTGISPAQLSISRSRLDVTRRPVFTSRFDSLNRSAAHTDREAEVFQSLNRVSPQVVRRRVEAKTGPISEGVMKEYIRALLLLNRKSSAERASSSDSPSDGQEIRGGWSGPAGFGAFTGIGEDKAETARGGGQGGGSGGWGTSPQWSGGQGGTVHVAMSEPTFRQQLWRTLRTLAFAYLLLLGITTIMEERGLARGMTPPSDLTKATESSKSFKDVVGVDEAKAELQEIVAFLRNPERFTRLGGKMTKGVLLMGPPGTGKTLLAKAIAGEAAVPFFYASGSEFEEMYVGVGARRVRELFESAKRKSPCIIFIDEIDAIGATRNPKDQQYMRMTLNQLLSEMDGFNSSHGIIVIAATNFPEVLDKALTRPGRFDRHVVVPNPDVRGRTQILNLHMRPIPRAPDVDIPLLARATPGFSGADLQNLVNIAAIKASNESKGAVSMADMEYAKDKILMGSERKSAVLTEEGKRLTAYHEGGHALVASYTQGAQPVYKATILPRGQALGMVTQLPSQDETSWTRKQMLARMDVCMAGRVAEELIYGADNVTSGASSDFDQATQIAMNMVERWGMSDRAGFVSHRNLTAKGHEAAISHHTRGIIDAEVRRMTDQAYANAKKLLVEHEEELHALASELMDKETLDGNEIRRILKAPIQPDADKTK